MSPIEYERDIFGRRLDPDPRLAASKHEFLLRIQAIWNSLPQADIQNLFDTGHVVQQHLLQLAVATPNTDMAYTYVFGFEISSFVCTNISRLSIKFHLILMILLWCCILYKQQYI